MSAVNNITTILITTIIIHQYTRAETHLTFFIDDLIIYGSSTLSVTNLFLVVSRVHIILGCMAI